MSGSIAFFGSLSASINGYRHHPSALCMCSSRDLQPNHLTCGLHPSSVDAPVDVHNPSHNFPFFHPWEASLVGHWVTTLLSCSCSILFLSLPKEVTCKGWDWYTCPVYDGCPYTRECQPLMQREEASFDGGLMTVCVGSSLCRRTHQL